MVNNGIKKCQIISYMVTLGLVTPIGIIIGIVLEGAPILIVGVMQGRLVGFLNLYVIEVQLVGSCGGIFEWNFFKKCFWVSLTAILGVTFENRQ